jgi:hypothetical protein
MPNLLERIPHRQVDRRLNVQRIRLPSCSPDALVARARSERPKLPFRPLSVEEAPRLYEQLYTDEIRFRKSAGK